MKINNLIVITLLLFMWSCSNEMEEDFTTNSSDIESTKEVQLKKTKRAITVETIQIASVRVPLSRTDSNVKGSIDVTIVDPSTGQTLAKSTRSSLLLAQDAVWTFYSFRRSTPTLTVGKTYYLEVHFYPDSRSKGHVYWHGANGDIYENGQTYIGENGSYFPLSNTDLFFQIFKSDGFVDQQLTSASDGSNTSMGDASRNNFWVQSFIAGAK